LAPREELEKPYRSINRRTLRIRSSAVVRHNRPPFLTTGLITLLIVNGVRGDTVDTTPLSIRLTFCGRCPSELLDRRQVLGAGVQDTVQVHHRYLFVALSTLVDE
jgi:hypothetical protein